MKACIAVLLGRVAHWSIDLRKEAPNRPALIVISLSMNLEFPEPAEAHRRIRISRSAEVLL